MVTDAERGKVREVVGVFGSAETLQEAIDELMSSGFDRAEISLLASEEAVDEKLGHKYKKVTELEDDGNVPRTHYVSLESIGAAEGAVIGALVYVGAAAAISAIFASGGALASVIAGATLAGGTGGLVGAVLAKMIGQHHAEYLQEQLRHGGLLLWVRTWDAEREKKATEILKRRSGRDVHAHTAA
jgi:microcompartment protein CcmK/EutM